MNLILHTMTSKNCVLRIKIFAHILLHLFTKLLCKTSSLSQKPFKYHIFFSFSLLLFSGRPIFEQYFTIRGQWQRHNFWRKVRMFWASRPGWWARLCSGQSTIHQLIGAIYKIVAEFFCKYYILTISNNIEH